MTERQVCNVSMQSSEKECYMYLIHKGKHLIVTQLAISLHTVASSLLKNI